MKVAVTAKAILDDKLGRLSKGQVVEMLEHKAMFYIARGDVERYETKVARDYPYSTAGKTVQLSASPAVEASPVQTLSESETGAKRRGRRMRGG